MLLLKDKVLLSVPLRFAGESYFESTIVAFSEAVFIEKWSSYFSGRRSKKLDGELATFMRAIPEHTDERETKVR